MSNEIHIENIGTNLSAEVRAQIKERFDSLSENVKNFITSPQYNATLLAISKTHKLSFEQLDFLQTEIFLTILGIKSSDEFTHALVGLGKNQQDTDALIVAINDQVFEKIKDFLHQVYTLNEVNN